jgi:heme-degrading monooxygenase HmoA
MAEHYASGNWHVKAGNEDDFVARWTEFLRWTREAHPGLADANLIRDRKDGLHFVSFVDWQDPAARDAWKQSAGFMERFTACRELCEDFYGGDYDRVVSV